MENLVSVKSKVGEKGQGQVKAKPPYLRAVSQSLSFSPSLQSETSPIIDTTFLNKVHPVMSASSRMVDTFTLSFSKLAESGTQDRLVIDSFIMFRQPAKWKPSLQSNLQIRTQ